NANTTNNINFVTGHSDWEDIADPTGIVDPGWWDTTASHTDQQYLINKYNQYKLQITNTDSTTVSRDLSTNTQNIQTVYTYGKNPATDFSIGAILNAENDGPI